MTTDHFTFHITDESDASDKPYFTPEAPRPSPALLPKSIKVLTHGYPTYFTISESEHRIHNPFTPEKYAALGRVLRMKPDTHILDLGAARVRCSAPGRAIMALPALASI